MGLLKTESQSKNFIDYQNEVQKLKYIRSKTDQIEHY